MANVVQDPKQHPKAIVADFSTPNPLVTFKPEDVAFTYGTKWKQRYWKKQGDDYFVLPAQWDVRHKVWRAYHVQPGTDWWVPHYPAEQEGRPTGPLCDGCHSVNYDIKTHAVTEWNVGCERCHGAGGAHVARPVKSNIVNPESARRCAGERCVHSVPLAGPAAGESDRRPVLRLARGLSARRPVERDVGSRRASSWRDHVHALARRIRSQEPDAGKRFRREPDVPEGRPLLCVPRLARDRREDALLKFPGNEMCLQCHGPQRQAGPGVTPEAHSHHGASSEGNKCVACHMPQIATTIADVSVRSHTFNFISPSMTDKYKIPNPCTSCHKDKTTRWALDALNQWSNVSPWRMTAQ